MDDKLFKLNVFRVSVKNNYFCYCTPAQVFEKLNWDNEVGNIRKVS